MNGEVTLEPLEAQIADDQTFLAQMRDTLALLNRFEVMFDSERAVCQAQIKTLMEECQVSLDERYPLASFTKSPSNQNLQVATEGVWERTKEIAQTMIVKVGELLRKIYRWIVEALQRLFGRSKHILQRTEQLKAVMEANNELATTVEPIDKIEETPETKSALEKYRHAVKAYEDGVNGIMNAMLTESPVIGSMKAFSNRMSVTADLVDHQIRLVYESIHFRQPQHGLREQDVITPLALNPVPIEGYESHRVNFPGAEKAETFAELFNAVDLFLQQLEGEHVKPMEWRIAAQVVTDPKSGLAEPIIYAADHVARHFQHNEKNIDVLMEKGREAEKQAKSAPLSQREFINKRMASIETMLMNVVADSHGIGLYVTAANRVQNAQIHLVTLLDNIAIAEFEVYRALAQEEGKDQLIVTLNRIQTHLREKMKGK